MPKIGDRHFAYTPEGMAAAERYKQSIGMNAGGMLGFRPLGYADGDLVEKYAYQDAAARQAAIDFILSTMGSTSDGMVATLLSMSDPDLRRAELKVIRDAEAGKYDSVPMKDISYTHPDIMPNNRLGDPRFSNRDIEIAGDPRFSNRDIEILRGQSMQKPKPSMPPMQEFNKRDIIPEFRGPNMGRLPGLQKSVPQMPQMPQQVPQMPSGKEPEVGYWIKDGGYVGRGMKNGGIMSLRRY